MIGNSRGVRGCVEAAIKIGSSGPEDEQIVTLGAVFGRICESLWWVLQEDSDYRSAAEAKH
jgi:hypothetical protein